MSKTPRDPIPKFASDEEAAEFWDTHSVADYWDEMEHLDSGLFRNARVVRTGRAVAPPPPPSAPDPPEAP